MRNPDDLDPRPLVVIVPASIGLAALSYFSALRHGVNLGPVAFPASLDLAAMYGFCTISGPLMAYLWATNPGGIIRRWERWGMGVCVAYLCAIAAMGLLSVFVRWAF